ncbi:MAG: metallophosphoesterase [Candidatus Hydrothermarchaeaceae archaeon]
MKLLCISDLHGGAEGIGDLSAVDAVVICGDITHFGDRARAMEILEGFKGAKRLLAVPGNCDNLDVNEALVEFDVDLHARGRVVGDIGFFGLGGSNATPFNTPQEYPEDQLWDFLMKGHEQVANASVKVMVAHTPPFNTELDKARMTHVGSKKVREFIETYEPDLMLCGHVHEARGQDRIGETVLVNPGIFNTGYALVDVGTEIRVEFFER